MYDKPYRDSMAKWITNHLLWVEGKHPDQLDGSGSEYENYADWSGNPPDVAYYRPNWNKSEMTWFQVYETVSEGTPVTPPFEMREELVEYLVANGDFWDQHRRTNGDTIMKCEPWSRKAAEMFVFGSGWAPSMISIGGELKSGVEGLAEIASADDARVRAEANARDQREQQQPQTGPDEGGETPTSHQTDIPR